MVLDGLKQILSAYQLINIQKKNLKDVVGQGF